MKQPELGKIIAELRKEKGLTQEELIEKCNVSIRTLQRIEAGEVTPRSYTVKAIFSALDYNPDKLSNQDKDPEKPISAWLNGLVSTEHLNAHKQFSIALIFGISYFLLTFIEAPIEYLRFTENVLPVGTPVYVTLKIVLLISFIFFQRGFMLIGELFNNYLLKIISAILIGVNVLIVGYDVVSVFYEPIEREFMLIGASLLFGVTGVVYGIALGGLEKSLGSVARFGAVLEVISGICFLTVILSLPGDLLHVPAELLQVIMVYKAMQLIKAEKTSAMLPDNTEAPSPAV